MNDKIVIISGPTASGKTAFAIDYALKNNGVIINADSRQIFKWLPILSAQPTDYEKKQVKHVLYDYLEPTDNISVGKWLELAKIEIERCFASNVLPIIVGGTGLYISKLIDGMSPIPEIPDDLRAKTIALFETMGYDEFRKKAEQIDFDFVSRLNANDKQRLMRVVEVYDLCGLTITELQKQPNRLMFPVKTFYHININPPKEKVYDNCKNRFEKMLEIGALNEVREFKKYNVATNTIGYNECLLYIEGVITKKDLIENVTKITRKYAKRQYTWFNHQFKNFDERI
ncbi:MAG: tRNA (adenosine(37)-N6)-dimethylallyltransferase MiaA [Rickettsiales bacterium]|jgi:tRNA dimethylallyltransferase|nr:tRNA (adenosine(37)-N6)-dimethylallyltransferase MiaA [Rickettsiales bacterium]